MINKPNDIFKQHPIPSITLIHLSIGLTSTYFEWMDGYEATIHHYQLKSTQWSQLWYVLAAFMSNTANADNAIKLRSLVADLAYYISKKEKEKEEKEDEQNNKSAQ